ncbi:MAG TPA: AI-2E family transporter [Candidatus Saccharimonadales bacterium]|nr:AI-2E family transporter [Candidatus Saccharimonadales bacterium]
MFRLKKLVELPEFAITITNETFFRLAGLTVLTIILLVAAQKAAHALLLIFIAFFLALALNGPVYWLSRHLPGKKRGSRSLATSISFLVVILLLGGFLASITPPLVRQTNSFIKAAPNLVQDFRSQDSQTGRFIRKHHLQKQVDSFSKQLSARLKNVGGAALSTAQKIGSSAFSLLTILVLTFMMLIEGPAWLAFMRDVIPDHHHETADRLAHEMYRVIAGYANGQVTLAALASVLIMPAVLLLHISYPVAIMVIIFICGLIPMVGHTIGAIIVTLVALFHATSAAIIILVYYILYQQIENYLIQPRIQANSTNMSPLLVFMSVVIGVSFGGLIGGLFAIPVAGCLRILTLEYLRSKKIIETSEVDKDLKNGTK